MCCDDRNVAIGTNVTKASSHEEGGSKQQTFIILGDANPQPFMWMAPKSFYIIDLVTTRSIFNHPISFAQFAWPFASSLGCKISSIKNC